MLTPIAHDCVLACINAISCVAFVAFLRAKALLGVRWARLAIATSIVLKVAAFCIDWNMVPSFGSAILAWILASFFDVWRHFRLEHLRWLLEALNAQATMHNLALVSTLTDVLVTSMSLTSTAWPLQSLVATLACVSMVCSVFLLVSPSSISTTVPQDRLLSVRQPLENFYNSTMSIIRDDLLDDNNQHGDVKDDEEDYLREFKAHLFDKHKLSQPLRSLLWTLRKPAIILAAFATVQAVCTCGRAVLIYCALSLLTNQGFTSYAAFLQCALSFAILYYAIAVINAKVHHFTIRLTVKMRTCILTMVGDKTLRLPRPAVIEADINSLRRAELEEFLAGIRAAPVGVANMLQICCSVYGLSFIIDWFAYLALTSILAYFGYVVYATARLQPVKDAFAEKRTNRLMGTQPILRNLPSIKTLGLQSYYLAQLKGLRLDEKQAWETLRNQMAGLKHNMMGSYAAFNLIVMSGLAYRYVGQATNAEDIFPTFMVLCILGESIANVKNSLTALGNFRYLQRVLDMLNMEDVPLRLEGTVEECAVSATTIRVRNLSNHHLSRCDDTLVLKSVNLELFRGDFLLIWGKTGSGKTTFLKTVLGEQTIKAASIHVADTSVAYCGQDTWLPDTSVQDCITGASGDVEESRYRATVAACRLPVEMTSLAYSSVAKIGPNGCHLSRTNRVKMILSRAVYAQASIVILDDTFSTFDDTEATELARTLLNPTTGLLRLNKATVILASHSFAVPALVDDVYCLATGQFILYPTTEGPATNHDSNDAIPQRQTMTASTVPPPALETSLLPIQHDKHLHISDAAKRISFQKNIAFIWRVMVDQETWRGLSLHVLRIVFMELPLMLGLVMWPQFGLHMHIALVLQLVLSAMYYRSSGKVIDKLTKIMSALSELSHEKIAGKIMTSSSGYTFHLSPGRLLDMLGNDLETLNTSPHKLDVFSCYTVLIFLLMAMLFWSTNYSVTAVLGTVICFTMIQHTWGGISKRATECSDHAKQKMNAKYAEAMDGLVYIRGFGWEQQMLRQMTRTIHESEAASTIALCIEPWFKMALSLYWTLAFSSIVIYSFCHPDLISPNMLGVGILTLSGLPDIANDALSISLDMKELVAATDRIRQFLTSTDELPTKQVNPNTNDKNWASIPDVTFENAEIGTNPPLNGKIYGAGRIQIHGRNGSGKTSLLLALLGMREYKGSIRIGGVEARDLSPDAISQVVAITPQDPIELPGTFQDNLFLREGAKPETKVAADAIRELLNGILEKLDLFHLTGPEETGYEKLVSEMKLSQGQIVLLNLARCAMDVLEKHKRIVVIDDVFSKLDKEYADMAKDFISHAFKACVVIQAETTNVLHLSIGGVQPLSVGAAEIGFHFFHPSQLRAWDEEVRQYFRCIRGAALAPDQASSSNAASSSSQAAPMDQTASSSQTAPANHASSVNQPAQTAQTLPLNNTPPTIQAPSFPSSPLPNPNDPWLQPRRRPPPRPPIGTSKTPAKTSPTRDSN